MTTATVTYNGDLRTTAVHLASNNQIITDAPLDNHGKGETFSPTDLVVSALGSCMITIMGIKAEDMKVDIKGTKATIEKIMSISPRRIAEIVVNIHVPHELDAKTKKILEAAAQNCPVIESLHPDMIKTVSFTYPS